jgi:hypothetical protein
MMMMMMMMGMGMTPRGSLVLKLMLVQLSLELALPCFDLQFNERDPQLFFFFFFFVSPSLPLLLPFALLLLFDGRVLSMVTRKKRYIALFIISNTESLLLSFGHV